MQEHWQQAKSIFQQAIELPPDQRQAFVSEQCPDESLRSHVWRLVELHDDESTFLETPISPSNSESVETGDALIGKTVGNFTIERRIGRGGMGAVYEAQQSNPDRKAAIKVLRFDLGISNKLLKRFQHESETLARLQHPGIAHVYESGTFDIGDGPQPWFAMELVDGLPLKDYLRQHGCGLHEKLNLFLQICDAVQHAHDRGVIHRDLKPSNILVERNDESLTNAVSAARPKVVDFGIARVADDNRERTALTATSEIMGTLDYLSPEQVRAGKDSLDHRCDVYALGMIGFEMISGRLPHSRRSQSIVESFANIGNESLTRLGEIDSNWSGDLQVIFGKALEAEPGRRYGSVRELADDVNRFLNQQPVTARPPSAIYRMTKFVRRNRALVTGTAATFVALLVGMIMYAMEARQARKAADFAQYEADKATAVNSYITNDFLTKLLAAARVSGSDGLSVVEMVDQAVTNVDTMFSDRPNVQAAIRNELGTIYYSLGAFDRAGEQYRQALDLWEENLGPDHRDTLKAVNNLGQVQLASNTSDETEKLLRRAYESRRLVLGETDSATLISLNNLAQLMDRLDRKNEARDLFLHGLDVCQDSMGDHEKVVLTMKANLGSIYVDQGELDKGRQLHQSVYEKAQQTFGPGHVTTLQAGNRYVMTLIRADEAPLAIETMESLLPLFEAAYDPDHFSMISAQRLMARVYRAADEKEKARDVLKMALEQSEKHPEQMDGLIRRIHRDLRRLED